MILNFKRQICRLFRKFSLLNMIFTNYLNVKAGAQA